MTTLRPVLDVEIDGKSYRLAANGNYSLHAPLPADAFGVVAHEPVASKDLTNPQVDSLLQLYGAAVEKCMKLEAALSKQEG